MKVSYMLVPAIIRTIEEIAAQIWGIDPNKIKAKTRKREVVEARQVCIKFRKEVFKQSLANASKPYGKDHATVIHAIKTVNNLRDSDAGFREKHNDFLSKANKSQNVN